VTDSLSAEGLSGWRANDKDGYTSPKEPFVAGMLITRKQWLSL